MTIENKKYSLRVKRFTEEVLDEAAKLSDSGNIPAALALILHNQGVINEKLNELLNHE